MGRLTLNVLLSFAQFEREVTGERIRDKIAASKAKGMWMGGLTPLGYKVDGRSLKIVPAEAEQVRMLFELYLKHKAVDLVVEKAFAHGIRSKLTARHGGGKISRSSLYRILANPVYVGEIGHGDKRYPGLHEGIVERGLFDQVQSLLAAHRRRRKSGAAAAEPALLSGLVFSAARDRLTSTHTSKIGRRYRYYATASGRSDEAPMRVPAAQLEKIVVDAVHEHLSEPQKLVPLLLSSGGDVPKIVPRAQAMSKRLADASGCALRRMLLELIERVTVADEAVQIEVRMGAIAAGSSGKVVISVAASLLARKGALTLVLPPEAQSEVDEKLVALIAQGRCWFDAMVSGAATTMEELARMEGVAACYARRVINLAFLAPDIVEQIVVGLQPGKLGADALIDQVPLVLHWVEQRRELHIG